MAPGLLVVRTHDGSRRKGARAEKARLVLRFHLTVVAQAQHDCVADYVKLDLEMDPGDEFMEAVWMWYTKGREPSGIKIIADALLEDHHDVNNNNDVALLLSRSLCTTRVKN